MKRNQETAITARLRNAPILSTRMGEGGRWKPPGGRRFWLTSGLPSVLALLLHRPTSSGSTEGESSRRTDRRILLSRVGR